MLESVTSLEITEQQAEDRLEAWLKARHLRIIRDISVTRLEGLTYWAFILEIDWYRKYNDMVGTWGFNVHDNGEITAIRITTEER